MGPADYTILPGGTTLGMVYWQHLSSDTLRINGNEVPDSSFEADVAILRTLSYFNIGETPAVFHVVAPFAASLSADIGSASQRTTEGLGDVTLGLWADPAYRSEEMEAKLRGMKLRSHIHRKGKRGKPLTEQAKSSNRTKSSVRARVEHVFGAQTNDMGGTLLRTIGLVRAKAKIGMKNLAYNMRRLVQLRRLNPCPA